jgi:phytoene dehydrogenase-like protein
MSKKVAIIGGGVAGLAAGIYGQINGYETEIIEMHDIAGGQCTAWERKGYRFDYCLHWLVGTALGPFHDVWKETAVLTGDTKIVDHEIFNRIVNESGEEFIIYSDLAKWEKYLLEMAPEDSKAIKKICSDMKKTTYLDTFNEPPGMRSVATYIKAVFQMFPTLMIMMKYGKKTYQQYFEKLNINNPKLKYFLGNLFGDQDFSALAFLMMLAWFNQKNAGYIIGGSLPMAQRMSERYKALGGTFNFGKRAVKINVENNIAKSVTLDDGSIVEADYIISAADGYSTLFEMLGGKYITPQIKNAYDNWGLFTPIVQVSFGVGKEVKSGVSFESVFKKCSIGSTKVERGYSFMNYSFDPTMAPAGKTVIVLRYESPWEIWKDMDKETYKAEKQQIKQKATELLEKKYPGITEFIEVTDVATPKTDVHYTGVWKGSYEGFLPSSKNIGKSLKMTLPGLENFYMAGQWLTPGGGLPPSALSGKWAFQYICKKDGKEFRVS